MYNIDRTKCTGASEEKDRRYHAEKKNQRQALHYIPEQRCSFQNIWRESYEQITVYGVNLPKIKAVMPTNLPAIEANELRIDNLFRLEDDSLALIDYESRYKAENKIKYLNYVVRTVKKEHLYRNTDQVLRVIIIYTGDITEKKRKQNWMLDVFSLMWKKYFCRSLTQ